MKKKGEGEYKEFKLLTGGLGHLFFAQLSCFWLREMDQTSLFSWPVISSAVLFFCVFRLLKKPLPSAFISVTEEL